MKKIIIFILTSVFFAGLFAGCGPSEEELRQREQARQDSLERVRQQRLEQQRQDSIARARAQARQDSIEAARKREEEKKNLNFDPNGDFAVQVEAWRSREKAEGQVSKWVERGFENAYVVEHGNENTGDIWFRVRLGRVGTKDMAQQVGRQIKDEYDAEFWIALARGDTAGDSG